MPAPGRVCPSDLSDLGCPIFAGSAVRRPRPNRPVQVTLGIIRQGDFRPSAPADHPSRNTPGCRATSQLLGSRADAICDACCSVRPEI
jgi:hypothetical protein